MPMVEAARLADIIISASGNKDIVRREHLEVLKGGCVMGNSGHFDNEISKTALEELAGPPMRVRESVDQYTFRDGRHAYLIAEGRLMNLAAGQGHPVEIMDMSFAIQALSLEHLVKDHAAFQPKVYNVPEELDQMVARTKLEVMGVRIDELTAEQRKYLHGWQEGT